jgi:hypothetical protein
MFVIVFKCFQAFLQLFQTLCFKCFIYLLLYVATIASRCFKSRSGVAQGCAWEAAGDADDGQGGVGDVLGSTAGLLLGRSLAVRAPSGR